MGRITKSTKEKFALLHGGGHLADVTDWVHPLEEDSQVALGSGEQYLEHIDQHLNGKVALGVYPLWKRNGVWMVNWIAVDLDDGEASSVHADNLIALLKAKNITAWKETSKSKGYHVWVYLLEPMAAAIGRNAMVGACRIIDVPTREVYPKQITLESKKIGNCLRLPYPRYRDTGRHEVFNPGGTGMFDVSLFTEQAWETRNPSRQIRSLLPLYEATKPKIAEFVHGYEPAKDGFVGSARKIWENLHTEDRSSTMYAFASSLLWQGFSFDATVEWVRRLDERLGKFSDRNDREAQLRNLVQKAADANA